MCSLLRIKEGIILTVLLFLRNTPPPYQPFLLKHCRSGIGYYSISLANAKISLGNTMQINIVLTSWLFWGGYEITTSIWK